MNAIKNVFRHICNAICHPHITLQNLLWRVAPHISNDAFYIKLKHWIVFGRPCNLKHPKSFSEKLQWIKLHDRKPVYHQMVDKVEMKQFVTERLGEGYVIPTLGVWDNFDDIDFASLPNEFILKNTNDSGTYYICRDKSELNIEDARKRLSATWGRDYYVYSREWPYKGLQHRIIAEPLLHDEKSPYLLDYKFYTFNGKPELFFIATDRLAKDGLKIDFFDTQGKHLDINQEHYRGNPQCPPIPNNLSKMVELAEILAQDTYHLRVDFYEVNDKIYVGELTFFDGGGFVRFTPKEVDLKYGKMIKLPIDK